MLENLSPAPTPKAPKSWTPAVEFDGTEGEATTHGFTPEEKPDFDQFLIEAGFDPEEIEIVGDPRTSRWQTYHGTWLTAYRFRFRKRTANIDLPTLMQQVTRTHKPLSKQPTKPLERCTLVMWADVQTGKTDHRGGTEQLIKRISDTQHRLEQHIKAQKPSVIMFNDLGDSIEGFESGGNPMRSNDLSLMQQIDLESTFRWNMIKMLTKYAPVIATSIGSNHCQWRQGKQRLGGTLDDWGIHINRTLARLCKETQLPVTFYEPQPYQESLAIDPFGDGYHIPAFVHGHQCGSPDKVPHWWRGQSHGDQPVAHATMLLHGHWHHTLIREAGRVQGRSRWIIGCPTLDNGSSFYQQTAGADSDTGLLTFNLDKQTPFTGTVWKI